MVNNKPVLKEVVTLLKSTYETALTKQGASGNNYWVLISERKVNIDIIPETITRKLKKIFGKQKSDRTEATKVERIDIYSGLIPLGEYEKFYRFSEVINEYLRGKEFELDVYHSDGNKWGRISKKIVYKEKEFNQDELISTINQIVEAQKLFEDKYEKIKDITEDLFGEKALEAA